MSSKPRLKIGYLVHGFPPEVGAGPARVSEMALRWQDCGAEVTVITGMPNRPQGRIHPEYRRRLFAEEDWNGIRVLRSWLFTSPRHGTAVTIMNNVSFMVTSTLHALARLGKLDVLIASSPPFFVHIGGEIVRRRQRIPLVLEVRDLWPDYMVEMGIVKGRVAPALLLSLERRLLRSADRVVVVTDDIEQRVREKGVDPARIHMVSNGVDPAQYRRVAEPAPLPALERNGKEEFVVGYLGNFGAGQQLETIVEAARILADQDCSIRIVMAGDGTQRSRVEQKVRQLQPPNLTVYPPISKEQTRAFYNACDVCLVPLAPFKMFRDAMPTKLFEIMGCEVPVVTALEGKAAQIVEQAACGVAARAGCARSIASAILEIKAWPRGKRTEAGQRGRQVVEANYARDVLARRYLELLSSLAARS